MKRRNFIKNTITTSTGMILFPAFAKAGFAGEAQNLSDLEKYFINPPAFSRPWVFWMWMNGNITKEGITADLEAMNKMGIGGVINFNSAVGIPRGPVDYAGDEWMEATAHAVREAQRLGISFSLHNSPGYSGCGGPWVTPEMSMQQLVWTETLVTSNGNIDIQLPQPYAKHTYYRDAFVIAYPSLPVEKALMKDRLARVFLNGKEIDKNIITDRNTETKIRLEVKDNPASSNNAADYDIATGIMGTATDKQNADSSSLVLEFTEPFEARAITLLRKPEIPKDLFDGPRDHPPVFRLEYSDDNIQYNLIGNIRPPELREMDTPASLTFNAVKAKFFRLTVTAPSWITEIELHNAPRLGGWPGKTNNTHGDLNGATPGITNEMIIDPLKVIDITNNMNNGGRLQWNAPPGPWTILRIGHTTTGEENAAHPDAGKGLEIDKFRKEALQFHFDHFLDKFIAKVKPFVGKSFKGVTVDSWEAGKQNWTIDFPSEFNKRKNYTIATWLPAMTGRIVGSIEDTENFLWEVRRVQADLLAENFYGHYQELCHQRGLEFYPEPYGDGNLDSLQVGQHLDIMMSEFWTRYIYGSDIYSKQAVSSAHIYGKKIVAAEAFTAMPATAKWTDYPYSLKAEGDYFFTLGVNRLVFHTFVHQPYITGKPGMTMGPFGMHIDRNNTWTEQAYGWTKYIQRSQYLLQQGLTVADVCYFKGDNPESGVPDIYRFLPQGYAGDVIGTDALHNRLSVKDGKIVLPDGMTYRLCIMAPLQQILPSTFTKIKQLVNDGMILLVSNKPFKAYGYRAADSEVQSIANELYGGLDGKTITESNYGKGKIVWGNAIAQVFAEQNIKSDFEYTAEKPGATIHYTHKRIGEDEFYFVTNHKRRKESIVCSFNVNGKQPEIWNSENGMICDATLYEVVDGKTKLAVELEPAGSVFIVFRKVNLNDNYTSIIKDGQVIQSARSFNPAAQSLYPGIKNNFTICLWLKPDSFAHAGRSMLFHAPEGEVIYGKGHAAIGAGAGQNGIRIYERSARNANVVLEVTQPLEGYTHIAIVYKENTPAVYVNGMLSMSGKPSSFIVHPGLGASASPDQFASYFEGNYTEPQLFDHVLTELEIKGHYEKGLPPLALPSGGEIYFTNHKKKMLFWENGEYALSGKAGKKMIGRINGCKVSGITGTWKVKLAGKIIELKTLTSLHKHPDFDIKHYSGTALYSNTISIAKEHLLPGKRLFLHLGRVEVVAEVKLNGKKTGLLWKEPFIIEVTGAARSGDNLLEIAVTNLWPNRLIGDEYLPIENDYSVHKFINKLPGWYVKNQPKPGERKSFAAWKTHEKTDPLQESGLLGPVKLIIAIEKII